MATSKAFDKLADAVANLDGRQDAHLKDYLVKTKTYETVFASPHKLDLVVGLKGSGKSSLFNTLTERFDERRGESKLIRIGISPTDATWTGELQKVNILQFSNSAKHGLAVYILRHLTENLESLPDRARIAKEVLRPASALLTRLKSLQGISIFGCGVSFKAPDEGAAFKPVPKGEMTSAVSLLKKLVATGFRVEVVTDDADRIFGGNVVDKHLLAGFILGCGDLKRQIDGLSVVHILKSHVKELLFTIEEFTNLSTRAIQYIAWEPEELLKLIQRRLEFAEIEWTDVFGCTRTQLMEFLVPKLRNGPRDLLRYIDIVLQGKKLGEKMSLRDFESKEQDYKLLAFQQMQVVYGDVFNNIGDFVRELFKKKGELTLAAFKEEYEKMRMESRPSALIYNQTSFSDHKEAFKSITESGCVDLSDAEEWIPPYREKYYTTMSHNKVTKIRMNYTIRP